MNEQPVWRTHGTKPFQIVLEGGAMRNVFTSGVLDFLLDQGVLAESVIGVSSGAICGFCYACSAPGRMAYCDIAYAPDWRFMSLRSKLATGNFIGVEFLLETIPNELERFDLTPFLDSPVEFVTVASDIERGEADYHIASNDGDIARTMKYIEAGASMPLANCPTRIDGKKLLDGGVCDCVPVAEGKRRYGGKQLVVLTQPRGFRQTSQPQMHALAACYLRYPEFARKVASKSDRYNATYEAIERAHDCGELYAIWPKEPLDLGMAESDTERLLGAYEKGLERTMELWPEIREYFEL